MTIFILFFTSKKVRGPEVKKSANRTGSGRGKGPFSKSDCPDLRGLDLLFEIQGLCKGDVENLEPLNLELEISSLSNLWSEIDHSTYEHNFE